MRCPRCESEFDEGVEYCPRDGSRLSPTGASRSDPFLGQVLDGRYRILSELGRGGMGVVYRARQVNVDRDVAIKVLTHEASAEPQIVKRFETEARIISRLRHPNTLKLIDFGRTAEQRLYIVNPLLEGRPLEDVLAQEGPLSVARTMNVLKQVCAALSEAHQEGIVHRDLKPGNIFVEVVGGEEIVKVLDFGIAKLSNATTKLTREGTTIGTAHYMSPEQARGESIDPRSDLYSLGVVAYECLSGRPPFQGGNYLSVIMKHLQEPPTPLGEIRPPRPVEPVVDELVLRCLEKLPEDRPADARTLRASIVRLERMLALGESDGSPVSTLPPGAAAPNGGSATPLWTQETTQLPASNESAAVGHEAGPAPGPAGSTSAETAAAVAEGLPRRRWMLAAAVIGLAIAGVAGWTALGGGGPAPRVTAAAGDAAVPTATESPAAQAAEPVVWTVVDAATAIADAITVEKRDAAVAIADAAVAPAAPPKPAKRRWHPHVAARPPAATRPAAPATPKEDPIPPPPGQF